MDTRLLEYFLAIAREENITKAAESLHITQPMKKILVKPFLIVLVVKRL